MKSELIEKMDGKLLQALGAFCAGVLTDERQAPEPELVEFLSDRVREGDAKAARILRFIVTRSGLAFFEEFYRKDPELLGQTSALGFSEEESREMEELTEEFLDALENLTDSTEYQ